jgi:hypothetical protein
MLVCQLMVWVLAAVKRFDTVALHAWQSARDTVKSLRGSWSGEADCG